jgi:hypothetical protein
MKEVLRCCCYDALFVVVAAPSRHGSAFPSWQRLSVISAKAGSQKTPKPNIQPLVVKAKKRFLPLDTRLRGYDGEAPFLSCFYA